MMRTKQWMRISVVVAFLFLNGVPGSVRAEGPEALDLAAVRAYAREHSPVLKLKQADIDNAQGALIVDRSSMLPKVTVSGGYDHFKLDHGIVYGAFGAEQKVGDSRFHGRILFDYVAFSFGRNYFSYKGAKSQVESRRRDLDRARETLSYQIARGYYAVLTVRETIRATVRTIDALKALEKQIEEKTRVGRLPEVDLLKVRSERAAAESDLARLRAMEEDFLRELCRLMGWEESGTPEFTVLPVAEEVPEEDYDPAVLLQQALAGRSDLAGLRRGREGVGYRLKSILLSYLPEVAVQAEVSEQSPGDDDFINDNRVGVMLRMPIFDGLVRQGEKQKLMAETARFDALEQDKKLEISRDVHTAVKGWKESRARFVAGRRAVSLGEEVLKVEKLKYKYGRTTINFVLEAESGLLEARSRSIQAFYDTELARENIRLAVGTPAGE